MGSTKSKNKEKTKVTAEDQVKDELTNDYILRKYRRYMNMLDQCFHGVVRERWMQLHNIWDFVILGKKTFQIAGLEWTQHAEDKHKETFHVYFSPDQEECTFEDWMKHLREFYAKVGYNRKTITDMSAEVNKGLFSLIDTNGDGTISLNEYCAYLAALGVPPEEAKGCFKLFDEDDNGCLDLKEFGIAVAKYFYDPYPSKYSHIYGRFYDLDTFEFGSYPIAEHLNCQAVSE